MSDLPIELYKVQQIRELEAIATRDFGLPEQMLMERAGRAAYEAMITHFPDAQKIAVICGSGSNAGDGYVVARLALQNELEVKVYALCKISKLNPTAQAAAKTCRAIGVEILPFQADIDLDVDLIVDAILGIGIQGDVEGDAAKAIDAINEAPASVLSIDVPSGINVETGHVCGRAVMASLTVTYVGLKQGLLTGSARQNCGLLVYDDLQLSEDVFEHVPVTAFRLDIDAAQELLPERNRDAHKGDFGHVLVIGGDYGMPGAVRLAAEAALRSGAGLVTVATRPEHISVVVASRPELMCYGIRDARDLKPLLEKATVIALGPGLGTSDWSKELYDCALKSKLPMVIDASALNFLAQSPMQRDSWVLTPHAGEAARLLKIDVDVIGSDRFGAALKLQSTYGGVIVLKGAGTLIQQADSLPEVCDAGNPGMASAGMGDVLTGVIAGLIAQGLSLGDCAKIGVCVHATAGDSVAIDHGERGLLATDLLAQIHYYLNPKEDGDEYSSLEEFGILGDLVASANDEEDK